MAEVSVLKVAAIRGNAGKYMSTANGVTMLSAPSRRMMNQFGGRVILDFVTFKVTGLLKQLELLRCSGCNPGFR